MIYKDYDWLYERYIEYRFTSREMAAFAGCGHKTILRWLRKHNIPIRGEHEWTPERRRRWSQSISGENHPQWLEREERICDICGCVFMTIPTGNQRFCSHTCLYSFMSGDTNPLWAGGRVERDCEICGNMFYVDPHIAKKGEGRFCSRKCQRVWFSKTFRGDKAPRWLGGISYEPYSPDFTAEFKLHIRKRDGYRCMLCGKTEVEELESRSNRVLTVHHIDYDKKNTSLVNCIALCNSCNLRANANRGYWQEKFVLIMAGVRRLPVFVTPHPIVANNNRQV